MKNTTFKTKFLTISAIALFGLFASTLIPTKIALAGPIALSCHSATIEGDFVTHGSPTTVWFDWGPGNSTIYSTPSQTFSSDQFFSATINNLSENSLYSYRAMASNRYGKAIGDTLNFTTPSCTPAPTPVNGGWSDWSAKCTQCGYSGTQTRTCTNPTPANGGAYCSGPSSQSYTNPPCSVPVNGGWSDWSAKSTQCGYSGTQTRTCTNPSPSNGGAYCSGSSTQSYTNEACFVQTPTVTLYANPSSIQYGGNSTLVWNSANATSCSSYWTSSTATSGSGIVNPNVTTTYSVTCVNSTGQQASASATVSVNQTTQTPTVTLYANPSSIQNGNSSILTWNSTNASYCSGSWNGGSATSGSSSVYPTYTNNYTITCYGTNGQQASAAATVYVNQYQQQTCQDTSANNYGGTLPCTYIQTCRDTSAINYGGVLPCRYNNYIQTCQDINANNYGGVLPCTYIIQTCRDTSAINYGGVLPCRYNIVVNNRPTVVLYSDQTNVAYNGSATLRWITTNATYCNASGGSVGWAGTKSIGPGSFYTGSLTGSRTFTLTCSNNFGTAVDSETITVRNQTIVNPKPIPTSLVLITSSVDRNQPIVPTIDNTRPRPGDEINYTVSYQNIGTGAISNLTLRVDLPYEVDYISSNPNNPNRSGNTLIFTLGTLKANGQGTVTIKTRVRDNIAEGTNLNFPATLSYTDPAGQPQSVNANVSAQVWSATKDETTILPLGANVFGAGFLPTNLFGWLLLLILILILAFLARYIFDQSFRKKTTVISDLPSGKKTTTTTVQ
ncbi:MAG: hypothetical protein WCW93_01730 [Candidatus Paceibacterota bacterium]